MSVQRELPSVNQKKKKKNSGSGTQLTAKPVMYEAEENAAGSYAAL